MSKKKEEIDFSKLVGYKAKLYLCSNSINQFQLGEILFEVVEDENDGYRSSMQEVQILNRKMPCPKNKLLAEVEIKTPQNSPDKDTYMLIDESGHTWLEFGTDHVDDYYPTFVFNWVPKPDEQVESIIKAIKK